MKRLLNWIINLFRDMLGHPPVQAKATIPPNATQDTPPPSWSLAWGNSVDMPFIKRLAQIRDNFNWANNHLNWLMACMGFESGRTFSPFVRNMAGSGAVGLIQFMPSTAEGLGTTTEDLAKMTAVEQLAYVERYFTPYYRRIHNLSDMYMAILMPAYVGKPESAVLFSKGVAYRENSGLDSNHDGKITKKEAAGHVQAMLDEGMKPEHVREVSAFL